MQLAHSTPPSDEEPTSPDQGPVSPPWRGTSPRLEETVKQSSKSFTAQKCPLGQRAETGSSQELSELGCSVTDRTQSLSLESSLDIQGREEFSPGTVWKNHQ